MSGHNKWSKIKHVKAKEDQKKGRLYTKLIREIYIAIKGGDNPNSNPILKKAIDNAKKSNMPSGVIERAIKKGSKSMDASNRMLYEGYGPDGVAFIIECYTDNKNRTVSAVRNVFTKFGGNLGEVGTVSYMFKTIGIIEFESSDTEERNRIIEFAMELGAEDIDDDDEESLRILVADISMNSIKQGFEKNGLMPISCELSMIPTIQKDVSEETEQKISRMIELLEEIDEVDNIYTNQQVCQ